MKKLKVYTLSFLLALVIAMMTACGSSDNNATSSESTAQTTAGGTETSRSGDNNPKESTGVIDGMK